MTSPTVVAQLEMLNAVAVPLFVVDGDARVLAANDAAKEVFGYSKDPFLLPLGGEVLHCLHAHDVPEACGQLPICESCVIRTTVSKSLQAPGGIHRRIKLQQVKDGRSRTLELEISARPLPQWASDATLLTVEDVTEAEHALRDSEERYRNLVESSPAFICLHKLDGTLISVNPAAADSLGYRPEDAPGRSVRDFMVNGDNFAQYADQLSASGEASGEMLMQTSTGDVRTWAYRNRMVRPSEGQEPYVLGLAIDVTERRRAEAERERLIAELQVAVNTVNTLQGILPICASCKNIRDDRGKWTAVEVYVRERSAAKFSHGICPDCARRLYPEYTKA